MTARWRWALFILVGFVVVVATVVTVVLLLVNGTGTEANEVDSLDYAEVVITDLVQEKTFDGTLGSIQDDSIKSLIGGTITQIAAPGETIEQGEALFSIDGEPVVLVYGELPAFRDIAMGEGSIVVSSQHVGRITWVAERGRVIEQGDVLFKVDDLPVVALYGDVPAYRPLYDVAAEVAVAEAAVIDAQSSLQSAEDALGELMTPSSGAIAAPNASVTAAKLNVSDAREVLNEAKAGPTENDIASARADVHAANVGLSNARGELGLVEESWAGHVQIAQDAYDDAQQEYQSVFLRWLGVELDQDELDMEAEILFSSWGIDLSTLFDPDKRFEDFSKRHAGEGPPDDDPATPWSEVVVYTWLNFHFGAILPICENDVVPEGAVCIQKEFDDAWDVYKTATRERDQANLSASQAIANAESAVSQAEDHLDVAEEILAHLQEGVDPTEVEDKETQLALALAELADAENALSSLMDPDPLEVEAQRKQVTIAQASVASAQDQLASVMRANTGNDILQLEGALEALGYDADGVLVADGKFTPETTKAVRAFQASIGLEPDGILDLGEVVFLPGPAQVLDRIAAPGDQAGGGVVRITAGNSASGVDVLQLEEALVALGYDAGGTLVADGSYTLETNRALLDFQIATGLEADGIVDLGEVVSLPGAVRITGQLVANGSSVGPGSAVLGISLSTKVVRVDLPANQQGLMAAGDAVLVEMPDFAEVPATVVSVSQIATQAEFGQATFDVLIELDDPTAVGGLDEAPVDVIVVSDSVEDVMAVPVSALVALLEGGYAVEKDVGGGRTQLVGVDVGFFGANGMIEITSSALQAGDRVVVP
jgi:peptidoglycan hydrolase-like protein with peptidoglycan-binding domain